MVNVVGIQSLINNGYGIAANILGSWFAHYTPLSTGEALVNYNMVDQLNLAFDINPGFTFAKPDAYKSDEYYGLCNLTTVSIGDYFWDFGVNTFFVANFEPLKPSLFVRCNSVISIARPASNNGYGANTDPTALLTLWPASILPGTKGQENVSHLPESVRAPWVIIHVPAFPGTTFLYGDIVTDAIGRRFVISDNQLTSFGTYHLTCSLEVA